MFCRNNRRTTDPSNRLLLSLRVVLMWGRFAIIESNEERRNFREGRSERDYPIVCLLSDPELLFISSVLAFVCVSVGVYA